MTSVFAFTLDFIDDAAGEKPCPGGCQFPHVATKSVLHRSWKPELLGKCRWGNWWSDRLLPEQNLLNALHMRCYGGGQAVER